MIEIEEIIKTLHSKLDDTADLKVVDESVKHEGHMDVKNLNGVSHILVDITWNGFEALSLLQRHRMLNLWLEEFFKMGLHSVRYKLKTFKE